MSTQRTCLAIRVQTDRFAPCVKYLFDLFGRVHNYDCLHVSPSDPAPDAEIVVSYSAAPPGEMPQTDHPHMMISRGAFFGESFGKDVSPPDDLTDLAKLAKNHGLSPLAIRTGAVARVEADIVASAFYLLSGYHDWVSRERDQFGRVLSTHVPLPPEIWDLPLVNHWFRQMDELLRALLTNQPETTAPERRGVPATQTICLTHDVDLIRKYRYGNVHKHVVRGLKAGSGKGGEEWKRARQVLSGKLKDPYDSFDQLYTVKERVSAPSTYFIMGAEPGGHNGDYKLDSREMKDLLVRARTAGDELALHGSWESGEEPGRLEAERKSLAEAARTDIRGARQHYLRYSTPETFRALSKQGVRYDSTGGFPDRGGFKFGWSGCFYPFDLDKMEPHSVLEIPLVCMDVTLAVYEKIPAELALERLTNLLDAACDDVPGGAFVFLWHNTMGDKVTYPGYWDTFEYFFSVASGAARFVTLSQLCDEFDGRAHQGEGCRNDEAATP